MKTGIQIIAIERQRQLEEEKFDSKRDDGYVNGELAEAASCYAASDEFIKHQDGYFQFRSNKLRASRWPWPLNWWKPSPDNRIKELAKAGALIAAEIDRLQRKNEAKN